MAERIQSVYYDSSDGSIFRYFFNVNYYWKRQGDYEWKDNIEKAD